MHISYDINNKVKKRYIDHRNWKRLAGRKPIKFETCFSKIIKESVILLTWIFGSIVLHKKTNNKRLSSVSVSDTVIYPSIHPSYTKKKKKNKQIKNKT